jgi:hypothetical protein
MNYADNDDIYNEIVRIGQGKFTDEQIYQIAYMVICARLQGRYPSFSDQYARAREEQADTLADEIQALSDEPPRMMLNKHGMETVDTGWLQWQKQRIDSRKWCASKLKPKKYGDRVSLAGDAENPLQTSVQVEASELFTSILQNLELKKQIG